MTEPLVSVVIPLHNSEEWIAETIRSVQAQTIDPSLLELIVVDNGSSDRGPEIVQDLLQAGPLRYECHSLGRNQGPSAARNAGWRRSRAPWIQFLDSDDLLAPEKIAHQWNAAASAPPEIAVVYSEWRVLLPCRRVECVVANLPTQSRRRSASGDPRRRVSGHGKPALSERVVRDRRRLRP